MGFTAVNKLKTYESYRNWELQIRSYLSRKEATEILYVPNLLTKEALAWGTIIGSIGESLFSVVRQVTREKRRENQKKA
jgi:hypothetical protein